MLMVSGVTNLQCRASQANTGPKACIGDVDIDNKSTALG